MDALDRKLIRDFRRLWAQSLAIALVLAAGVAILMTTFGMYQALEASRAAYYERSRFADVFAQARRVPRTLMPEILAIPGVYAAEGRVSGIAVLDLPGRDRTALGQVLSLPADGAPRLNQPILRQGRWPDPASDGEVAVNQPFAVANGFAPGDRFTANLNGRKRALTITGTFLSPEFIYTLGPGAMMPDNEGYGILYLPERLAAATFGMEGAFDSLSVKLAAGANAEEVIDRLDNLLEPYGGLGAHDRARQQSHAFVDAELKQLRSMSVILPPIFFGITAFLVNMVIGRIVFLERAEIGLLKAIGYSNARVATHYLLLAALVAVAGVALGWAVGSWLTRALAALYAQFFDFPYLIYHASPAAYAVSGLLALAAASGGALQGALRAARMAPAVAMQPPAPPVFRRGYTDRVLEALRLSQPMLMVLRNLMRWPVRTALTALGLSLAVAILVSSSFFNDALDEMLEVAFRQGNRQDAMLLLARDSPEAALEEVRRLPGVLQAEGQLAVAAELSHGHRTKLVPIEARRPGADLSRVVGIDGRPVDVPAGGLMLAEGLAQALDLRPGDMVEVRFLSGRRETVSLPVTGVVRQYIGLGAYMDFETLNRVFRQAPRISVAVVDLDEGQTAAFHRAAKDLPGLAGTVLLTETRAAFRDTIRENVTIMTTIYLIVAGLITLGVAYNSARIQLSERARELASLRILGFTRAEVSLVLMGETLAVALLAQPLGWLIGAGIALAASKGFESDLYRIPLVLKPATFAYASLAVLAAALMAALLVRRRLDRLDLVRALKTRE